MPVSINITGENAEQAIQEFSVLSAHFVAQLGDVKPVEMEKPKRQTRQTAPKETVKPDPVQDEDETGGGEDEDAPTVVELRAKAQEVGTTAEAKKAIKELLNNYGSKSISDIPEDKRAAFMAALEAI